MNVPENEIKQIHKKLDEIGNDIRNLKTWTKIPDNFDGASVHETRDIGITIRQEMREVLGEFFSPKRIISALVIVIGLVKAVVDGIDLVIGLFN